jgi:cyclopropane-fatty-acyl-phospholipid synthase
VSQTAGALARRSLVAPLPVASIGPFAAMARRMVIARLAAWREGFVRLRLGFDGREHAIGDPRARDRGELVVHDEAFFARVLLRGEMGAGESYVAGEWDSPDLVAVIRLFLRNLPHLGVESGLTRVARLPSRLRHVLRRGRRRQSERNIHAHYDLGNDFYRLFLDESMAYSCAVFAHAGESLADAQRRKFERVCDKLGLGPRDHVLEVGCGWGGLAIHAVRTRGCRFTGITISREQYDLARARVAAAGLADRIDVQYRDYRDVRGRFDKLVSIEMLEAVGHEYYPAFFARCAAALAPGGTMVAQTIAMPEHRYEAYRRGVDWTQAYVFPGVLIPSLSALAGAMARASDLSIVDVEDIGLHYAPTLRAWRERFLARRDEVAALGFDAAFVRTWVMYLSFSEAAFAERDLGDLQIVFSKPA